MEQPGGPLVRADVIYHKSYFLRYLYLHAFLKLRVFSLNSIFYGQKDKSF